MGKASRRCAVTGCRAWAMHGSTLCRSHAGAGLDVATQTTLNAQEHAAARASGRSTWAPTRPRATRPGARRG